MTTCLVPSNEDVGCVVPHCTRGIYKYGFCTRHYRMLSLAVRAQLHHYGNSGYYSSYVALQTLAARQVTRVDYLDE